jgi:hypothetical protein
MLERITRDNIALANKNILRDFFSSMTKWSKNYLIKINLDVGLVQQK